MKTSYSPNQLSSYNTILRLADIMTGIGAHVLGLSDNKLMIVTQGCSHNKCPSCMSPHTWDSERGQDWHIDEIIQLAHKSSVSPSGLVISGGEPLDQAPAIAELIKRFREHFTNAEVIMFTAYRPSVLSKIFDNVMTLLDVAVAGPYVEYLPGYSLVGSSNQQVLLLTDYAKRAYRDWKDWQCQNQVFVQDKQVTVIGLQDTRSLFTTQLNTNSEVFFRQLS